MCRYAMTSYKPHFACFECRKSFKRRLLRDINRSQADSLEKVPAKCPECSELMADMGMDFKAPKKSDLQAWKHLKNLYQVGIVFHSCGCTGPGYVPRDNAELIAHFEEIKQNYLENQRFWARRGKDAVGESEVAKDRHKNFGFLYGIPKKLQGGTRKAPQYDALQAQVYWNDRVKEVEEKIAFIRNT